MTGSPSSSGSLLVSVEEHIWWTRLDRGAARAGKARDKAMADWCHKMLAILGAEQTSFDLIDGHWQPIPAERCTPEYKARETRRLNDELGRALGVGPMP